MRSPEHISAVVAALDQIAAGIDALRSLGVIRSRKVYEDLAEWLVAQLFDGQLAPSKIQAGWDVQAGGQRIQVRSHSKAADNPNRWSGIKPGGFDSLAIVVFNESFRVVELYLVSAADLIAAQTRPDRVGWDALGAWRQYPGTLSIPEVLHPLFA